MNTVTVDKCKKTNDLNNLMGGEIVNCKSLKVQANGTCPTVAVDKTDGSLSTRGNVLQDLDNCRFKGSEMNVSWPGATPDDAY